MDSQSLEMMGSVRVAKNGIGGALEVAAEYVENGVRRATDDTACERRRNGLIPTPTKLLFLGFFLMPLAVIHHLLLL